MKKQGSVFSRGTTDEEKTNRLMAGSIISLLSTVFGGLFGTFWIVAMTRLLGSKDFGIFGPVHNVFWLSVSIATLGINSAITTFVAHHWEKEPEEAKKFSSDGTKLLLILGLIIVVFTFLISGLLYHLKIINNIFFFISIIIAIALFFYLQASAAYGILLGLQRADLFAFNGLIYPIFQFISSYLLVTFAQRRWGAESYFDVIFATSGMMFGGLANMVAGMLLLKKIQPEMFSLLYDWRKKYNLYKKIISFGGITTIANLSYNAFCNMPTILVGIIAVKFGIYATGKNMNLRESGYFGATIIYASAAMMIMGLVFPLIPAISEAESSKRLDLMQHYHDLILKSAVMIVGAVFVVYYIIGGYIINLLAGSDYPVYAVDNLIKIISLGVCLLSLFFLYLNISIGIKKPHLAAIAISIGLFIQIITVIAFSYIFKNINGPAFGYTLSSFLSLAISLVLLSKASGIKIKLAIFGFPLTIGLISYIIAKYVIQEVIKHQLSFINGPFPLALASTIIGLIIYFIVLFITDRLYLIKIAPLKFKQCSSS